MNDLSPTEYVLLVSALREITTKLGFQGIILMGIRDGVIHNAVQSLDQESVNILLQVMEDCEGALAVSFVKHTLAAMAEEDQDQDQDEAALDWGDDEDNDDIFLSNN